MDQPRSAWAGCVTLDIGLLGPRVGRLSVAGELGYEINVSAAEHVVLRETLLDAGRDLGLREYGFYAMNSLWLEKSFGIWSGRRRCIPQCPSKPIPHSMLGRTVLALQGIVLRLSWPRRRMQSPRP